VQFGRRLSENPIAGLNVVENGTPTSTARNLDQIKIVFLFLRGVTELFYLSPFSDIDI
jgi:hypothetical protein